MIFLIEYDRRRGELLTFHPFADADRAAAEQQRLDLELKRGGSSTAAIEIVLLQAESETALRLTHRRYFQTARQIIESSTGATS